MTERANNSPFSNKIFLNYTFFSHNAIMHLIDITSMCTGKPKNLCDSLNCNIHFITVV